MKTRWKMSGACLILVGTAACGGSPGAGDQLSTLDQTIVNGFTNVPNAPAAVGYLAFLTLTRGASGFM